MNKPSPDVAAKATERMTIKKRKEITITKKIGSILVLF